MLTRAERLRAIHCREIAVSPLLWSDRSRSPSSRNGSLTGKAPRGTKLSGDIVKKTRIGPRVRTFCHPAPGFLIPGNIAISLPWPSTPNVTHWVAVGKDNFVVSVLGTPGRLLPVRARASDYVLEITWHCSEMKVAGIGEYNKFFRIVLNHEQAKSTASATPPELLPDWNLSRIWGLLGSFFGYFKQKRKSSVVF